jgi:hypothetical protein
MTPSYTYNPKEKTYTFIDAHGEEYVMSLDRLLNTPKKVLMDALSEILQTPVDNRFIDTLILSNMRS